MADVPELLEDIQSPDKDVQGRAFETLMAATDTLVDWPDDAWDRLVTALSHPNNRTRAIAAQLLCNLAKSADDGQVLTVLPALLAVTHDERFVTARHCLQSLWKIGVAGPTPPDAYRRALAARFAEAADEKNGTLVRADIIESLRRVHDDTGDKAIEATAEELLASEQDDKYRRKYTKIWKASPAP